MSWRARRREALALRAQASELAGRPPGGGEARVVSCASVAEERDGGAEAVAAIALKSEIEQALDELRARGYRELPDGRWVNPRGRVVRGSRRR